MAAAENAAGPAPQSVAEETHDLYRRYGRQIYAYCLHQLRSREEAEDAVQTTFLNAFRGLQRGTTTRFEQAWLYKIAQNVCIARRSSSSRRLRLESPDDFEILQEVIPSPDTADGDTLELMGLDDALDSMPENQRRAILMREWQGMSYREIAAELGLTHGAVEMLIFRARRTLASALEQPAADKKRNGKASTGFGIGSLIATMKSLFSTSVGLKMAAVAVSAAVVGTNGVVDSVVTHVSAPAKKRAAARPVVHFRSVQRFIAPTPAVASVHDHGTRSVVAPVPQYTSLVTRKPVVAPDVDQPSVQSKPASTPTPPATPVQTPPQATAPPQLTPGPAPQVTATPPAPVTPPPTSTTPETIETPSPQPPPVQTTTGDGPPKDGSHDRQTAGNTAEPPSGDAPPAPPTTTTPAPPTTTTPTPDPIVAPAPVPADPVTTTSTLPSSPPDDQPAPTPARGTGQGDGGGHDSSEKAGGSHGRR